jgi:hypothetical protein
MTSLAVGAGIVFFVIGSVLGWHSHTTFAAHGDVKVAKTRLRGGRKTRWRSAVWVVAISIVLVLVAWNALKPH